MKAAYRTSQVEEIIGSYPYPLPFHTHLKDYFKAHKQFGSRDRRLLRDLCYHFFRLGRALPKLPFETRVAIGHFLCVEASDAYLEEALPELSPNALIAIEEKLRLLGNAYADFPLETLFPYPFELSKVVSSPDFFLSQLKQPFVWVKARKGKENALERIWQEQELAFVKVKSGVYKFPPEAKLTEDDAYQRGDFRIQDLSTQETGSFFDSKPSELWWDACCGAGGKSLSLLDKQPNVRLFATDIRESILHNYRLRLQAAGHKAESIFEADVSKATPKELPLFDNIILDVPCTGSGTWARTPEHLVFFKKEKIAEYAEKQFQILRNAFPKLKPGGCLYYITCSVYRAENEENIARFLVEQGAEVAVQQYVKGFERGSENIFLCKLIRRAE